MIDYVAPAARFLYIIQWNVKVKTNTKKMRKIREKTKSELKLTKPFKFSQYNGNASEKINEKKLLFFLRVIQFEIEKGKKI